MAWAPEGELLDVGCGDGLITWLMRWRGIDTDALAIRMATERGALASLGSVYDLRGHEGVPGVYLGDVIEHLEFPAQALREIARVTKRLYLVTPPRVDAAPHAYHYREWTPVELREYMQHSGWEERSSQVAHGRIYAEYERIP